MFQMKQTGFLIVQSKIEGKNLVRGNLIENYCAHFPEVFIEIRYQ